MTAADRMPSAYGSLAGVRYGEGFVRSQAIPIFLPNPAELLG